MSVDPSISVVDAPALDAGVGQGMADRSRAPLPRRCLGQRLARGDSLSRPRPTRGGGIPPKGRGPAGPPARDRWSRCHAGTRHRPRTAVCRRDPFPPSRGGARGREKHPGSLAPDGAADGARAKTQSLEIAWEKTRTSAKASEKQSPASSAPIAASVWLAYGAAEVGRGPCTSALRWQVKRVVSARRRRSSTWPWSPAAMGNGCWWSTSIPREA